MNIFPPDLVEAGAEKTRDLLDEGVGAQEGVIALRQPLDLLLVLIELLQVISRHGGDALLLGLVNVGLVSQETDLELPPGDMPQPRAEFSLLRRTALLDGS